MARRSSTLAPPAVAGGAGVLVLLVCGLTFASPTPVQGLPLPAQPGLQLTAIRKAAADSDAALAGLRSQIKPKPAEPTTTAPARPPQPTATQPPTQAQPAPPAPPRQAAGQRPGTLRLAKGGTATLVRKELGPDATLPVPSGVREATWWGAGLDAPAGASVFAGHVNWKGATGPFAELWSSRVGDLVSVVDDKGTQWRYRVTQVETVGKHDLPARAEEFFGQTGPHRVVLVTCGGQWVGGADGYESNRVVVAVPA
ncbi:class F sortase [Actinokineospora cianjurensis]|uniref:class F sortase n=1 Tax=Actinokineospora cianjurensis TaxID=585224 RepID=UPI000EB41AB0|nr:class F sortase [Actinokineospora cianjurensis]